MNCMRMLFTVTHTMATRRVVALLAIVGVSLALTTLPVSKVRLRLCVCG
jgi:hypothetical protein